MAGLELPLMHLGLTLLGLLVRLGLVRSLRPLARPLRLVADVLAPLGTDRGGMIVAARGLDGAGRRCQARWALWAEANAGPTTPAAPAAALVRACWRGGSPRPARGRASDCSASTTSCGNWPICLSRLGSTRGCRTTQCCFGASSDGASTICRVRSAPSTAPWSRLRSRGAPSPGPEAATSPASCESCSGLPASGPHAAQVTIAPVPRGEVWTRRFGASRFASRLADTDRLGLFEERIGTLRFAFELRPTSRGVFWRLIGWRVGPLPLPLSLAPQVRAVAEDAEGRYRFRVVVAHPWLGLLFAYRGVLEP